jgi:hypothetical protein
MLIHNTGIESGVALPGYDPREDIERQAITLVHIEMIKDF